MNFFLFILIIAYMQMTHKVADIIANSNACLK